MEKQRGAYRASLGELLCIMNDHCPDTLRQGSLLALFRKPGAEVGMTVELSVAGVDMDITFCVRGDRVSATWQDKEVAAPRHAFRSVLLSLADPVCLDEYLDFA